MNPTLPNTIPAAYVALGATSGFNPKAVERLNWLLASEGGLGKTTFASSIPHSLLIDLENGSHSVVHMNSVRVPVARNYEKFEKVMSQLVQDSKLVQRNPAHLPFQTVIIDSVDVLADTMAAQICAEKSDPGKNRVYNYIGEYGSGGAGWALLRNRVTRVFSILEEYGYAWVAICHKTERLVETADGRRAPIVQPTLFGSCYDDLQQRADLEANIVVLRTTEHKTEDVTLPDGRIIKKPAGTVTTISHVLKITPDESRWAKRRLDLGTIPDIAIPRDNGWNTFATIYSQRVAEIKKTLEVPNGGRN